MNAEKNNTVTATTATVKRGRGRFAPSPTGPLHAGSLLTAVASFLDARQAGEEWHLRIEDIDLERSKPEFIAEHPRVLEQFGLWWDGPIIQQSQRLEHYFEARSLLIEQGRLYGCQCSRKDLANEQTSMGCVYPGTCRSKGLAFDGLSLRFRMEPFGEPIVDRLQPPLTAHSVGAEGLADGIIWRKTQTPSYDLAVVVDDALMGITSIVRGADIWPLTARHVQINQALGYPLPRTLHVPLLTEANGEKLSKSKRSVGVNTRQAASLLSQILTHLRLDLPKDLVKAPVREQLTWAIPRWDPNRLKGIKNIELADF